MFRALAGLTALRCGPVEVNMSAGVGGSGRCRFRAMSLWLARCTAECAERNRVVTILTRLTSSHSVANITIITYV